MTEDLQNLLNRIHEDGVEQAEEQKNRILSDARQEASAIVKAAENKAATFIADAEKEAQRFSEQGARSLQQASRNVVLAVEEAVQDSLRKVVAEAVKAKMDSDLLLEMIPKVVDAYAAASGESKLEVLLSPEDSEKLTTAALGEYAGKLKGGLDIRGDRGVLSGFRVTVVDEDIEHDFTGAAISNAICSLLRPKLAKIMRESRGQLDAGDTEKGEQKEED